MEDYGPITAIVGTGNNFKSTIMHYMMLSAANRVFEATPTQIILRHRDEYVFRKTRNISR